MKVTGRYSLIEVLIVFAVILVCARYIWAKELIEFENQTLINFGVPVYIKYFVTAPLAALFFYGIYGRETAKARNKGIPVARRSVVLGALVVLSVAVLLLVFTVSNNA